MSAFALSVILVSPKTPGNIGSAARAMKNMGANDLRIVAPRCNVLDSEAIAFSVHAEELVRQAPIFATLEEATADLDFLMGTTARQRDDLPEPIFPSEVKPMLAAFQKVGVVFGREESGLTTDELARCQSVLRIPTSDYASLNLAQAVLLCCYELLQAERSSGAVPVPVTEATDLAPREQMERFYEQLQDFILKVNYTDQPRLKHKMRQMRKVFDQARMTEDQIRMLRGLWAQALWAAKSKKFIIED
ncbi:RNA methyltransferase [Deinococcus roseus]|uniref:tRNA (cytidine/uridine-2'-O-)-methyltransferase TrmJ n=1 Tax=Deinococcus roseus TaxID=392414 RepID=A0ABQ2DKF5_9DEIO|nr:RNA methyltransferase [Deinococcus roseus]GGJ57856.1 tRNA (cytidine/uridine-2'-O-)-methyltransferase TrmJ [Deinococcus roseus]